MVFATRAFKSCRLLPLRLLPRPSLRSRARYYSSTPTSSGVLSVIKYVAGTLLFGSGISMGVYWNKVNDSKETLHTDKSTSVLESVPPAQYATEAEFKKAIKEITKIVGKNNISTDKDVILSHSDSFFSTHHPPNPSQQKPLVVIYPSSTEEVAEIMKVVHNYRVPIVASSGLTSLEGHTMHTRGPISVSISFERMDKVLAVHPIDLDAVVQPGVGWQELDEYLLSDSSTEHLMLGPDPGIGAKIGGMVGSSCSGTNAYKYGTMKENVVNLTVVLADGTIVKTKQRPRKSSAGYDMTRLFIGSEGTLGVITEITVKLNVRPKLELVSVATFPSIADAASTAQAIIKSGLQMNAIELLNSTMVSFVNKYGGVTDENDEPKQFLEKPTLLFKVGGPSKTAIEEQLELIETLSKENHLIKLESSHNEEENAVLWSSRRNGLWSTVQYGSEILEDKNDVQIWTTDFAVPISHLANVIAETNDDLNNLGFQDRFSVLGHVGDGNCHFLIVYNSKDYKKVSEAVDRMVFRALKYEGTCTGEHGVGVGKRKYLNTELGSTTVDLMRHLKLLLDPRRILNPDKIFKLDSTDTLDEQLEHGAIKAVGAPCCSS
mmetsp:Transcript_3961/g.3862  ORF Transcript_3961/g.3862 Transcript_3961/m.3862 type:complete len:604 (+) Transcript_3961:3408-5219(+)